jgi:hypothetical protein
LFFEKNLLMKRLLSREQVYNPFLFLIKVTYQIT